MRRGSAAPTCAWLASLPPNQTHEALDSRLQRIEALRTIFDDSDWDTDEALQSRLRKLFAYIDLDEDLVPDHEPLLGKLDDALLVELAWPAFVDEAEDYRDFCDYRETEHPAGDGSARRSAWMRDRLAELSLWQHQLRVNDRHYGDDRPAGAVSGQLIVAGRAWLAGCMQANQCIAMWRKVLSSLVRPQRHG